jgi:hypothetical protein
VEQSLLAGGRSRPSPKEWRGEAERKQHAYRAGDAARDQGIITPEAHMLYEYLLRFASCKSFCWPGQERLASTLKCSVSTIKRRTRELVAAGLIRRERRLNRSSLTFISAYQPDLADDQAEVEPESLEDDDLEHSEVPLVGADSVLREYTSDTGSTFFAPPADPPVGPAVSRPTIKSQNPEDLGGGKDTDPESAADNEATDALQHAGVIDQGTLSELRECPIRQVEQAIAYAAKCRTAGDPRRPGLIVYLLRRGFGSDTRAVRGGARRRRSGASSCIAQQATAAPEMAAGEQPVVPEGRAAAVWNAARARLAEVVAPDDFTTWLQPAWLFDIVEDVAVLVAPNVFVRDKLGDTFIEAIVDVLAHEVGRAVQVELVIGDPEKA